MNLANISHKTKNLTAEFSIDENLFRGGAVRCSEVLRTSQLRILKEVSVQLGILVDLSVRWSEVSKQLRILAFLFRVTVSMRAVFDPPTFDSKKMTSQKLPS